MQNRCGRTNAGSKQSDKSNDTDSNADKAAANNCSYTTHTHTTTCIKKAIYMCVLAPGLHGSAETSERTLKLAYSSTQWRGWEERQHVLMQRRNKL